MATFKVGDRVRIVSQYRASAIKPWCIGREGVIVSVATRGYEWVVRVAGVVGPRSGRDDCWCFDSHQLAPLTPPAEDAWAADKVRQVTKPLHMEPVAPKVSEVHNQGNGNG